MTSDRGRCSFQSLRSLFLILLLTAVLPNFMSEAARAAEPKIEASLRKDGKSGRIEGTAEMTLDLPASRVWPILADAVHGKLSERTRLCLDVPEAKASEVLRALDSQRLPIASGKEDSARKSLTTAGNPRFEPVGESPITTRYALRVVSVPIPLASDRWFLARETFDARKAKDGRYALLIEGHAGNITHYDGRWTLETLPNGGTRVRLHVLSDMGIPTPGFLTGLGTGELRESFRKLHELATATATASN